MWDPRHLATLQDLLRGELVLFFLYAFTNKDDGDVLI
jgi:hypothetical protein